MIALALSITVISLIIIAIKSAVVIQLAIGMRSSMTLAESLIQYIFVVTQDLLVFAGAGLFVAVCLAIHRKIMAIAVIIMYSTLRMRYGIDSLIMMLTASRVTFREALTFLDFIPRQTMMSGVGVMIVMRGLIAFLCYNTRRAYHDQSLSARLSLFPKDNDLSHAVILMTITLSIMVSTQLIQSVSYYFHVPIVAAHWRQSPIFLSQSHHSLQSNRLTNTNYEDRYSPVSGLNHQPNIIVVFAESVSLVDSLYAGGINNTFSGHDQAQAQGLAMTNMISNGCTSDASHVAFLMGIEPRMHAGLVGNNLYEAYTGFTQTLPRFAQSEGYKTSFYSTAPLDFLDQEGFINRMGFESIVGPSQMPESQTYTFDAAPDEILYQKILADLKSYTGSDKQFLVSQTISTHLPYSSPYGNTRDTVSKYADDSFATFYQGLVDQQFFDDGILIVMGDHRKMTPITKKEVDKRGRSANGRVVGFMVGTGIASGTMFSPLIQHNDIHYNIKQLIASHDFLAPPFRTSVWTPETIHRDMAVRYCSFVERDYVISRRPDINGREQDIVTDKLSKYISDFERFQQGERKNTTYFTLTLPFTLTGWLDQSGAQTGIRRTGIIASSNTQSGNINQPTLPISRQNLPKPSREPRVLSHEQQRQSIESASIISNDQLAQRGHGLSGIVLVGHGGAPGYEPYNSFAGFAKGVDQGADGIEFDVSFTKDMVPIIAHGPDIWSLECPNQQIRNTFWEKIRTDCPLRNGETIMDLETMLRETDDFIPHYFLEIKTEKGQNGIRQAQIVINIIRKLGMQDVITVIAYDPDARRYIGTVGDIRVGRDSFDVTDLDVIHSGTKYEYFMSPFQNWTPDIVATVKAKGMSGMTYTPKTDEELLGAYRVGVREFMVDDIPWAIKTLRTEIQKTIQTGATLTEKKDE